MVIRTFYSLTGGKYPWRFVNDTSAQCLGKVSFKADEQKFDQFEILGRKTGKGSGTFITSGDLPYLQA